MNKTHAIASLPPVDSRWLHVLSGTESRVAAVEGGFIERVHASTGESIGRLSFGQWAHYRNAGVIVPAPVTV